MPVTGPLSHIDISVGDSARSISFYDALLTALGFTRWKISAPEWAGDNPARASWSKRYPDGSQFGIEVRPACSVRRYDRYEPGPHHIAFHAESDAVVDAVHRAVVAASGEVLDAPTNYGGEQGYGDYYYAAFFADPDGVKLEVCYVPVTNP